MQYLSIKKLYAEFERLQNIMQDLKKENYNLKTQLKESEGLMEKVAFSVYIEKSLERRNRSADCHHRSSKRINRINAIKDG